VRDGPAHELTAGELIAFWSVLPREAREILSEVIVDKVAQPRRSRTLSEAVAACEAKRRRQLRLVQARLRKLEQEQARMANGGHSATGRPKARQNRYSGQQLQALSRAWSRFETASRCAGADHEGASSKIDAFLRSLAPRQRAWLPKMVKPDTVRKLIQQGSGLRRASKTWRAQPGVADVLQRLMQVETSRHEVNRIVRELASLQPGTEIAERRLTAFVSETILRHHAVMSTLGIEESFIKLQAK
jgi:hypothetical protein